MSTGPAVTATAASRNAEVTQADRDAGQALLNRLHEIIRNQGGDAPDAIAQDDGEIVQAFVRFRISQLPRINVGAMRDAIGDAIVSVDTGSPEWRGVLLESIVAALRDTDAMAETGDAVRDQGLTVGIQDGRLVISIGIDALMVAVEGSPIWENAEAEERGWTIDNPDGFANDICAELEQEEEDGTTLVHIAIDSAIERAIEGGSLNIGLGKDG